jgi:hypothetical protein
MDRVLLGDVLGGAGYLAEVDGEVIRGRHAQFWQRAAAS